MFWKCGYILHKLINGYLLMKRIWHITQVPLFFNVITVQFQACGKSWCINIYFCVTLCRYLLDHSKYSSPLLQLKNVFCPYGQDGSGYPDQNCFDRLFVCCVWLSVIVQQTHSICQLPSSVVLSGPTKVSESLAVSVSIYELT